jgi:hypothetical protein
MSLGCMPIISASALMTTLPTGAYVWTLVDGACYTLSLRSYDFALLSYFEFTSRVLG